MSSRGHYTKDFSGSSAHGEFMAFVQDEDTLSVVRDWAVRQGFPTTAVQQGGSETFSQILESSSPPKTVMVDFDHQEDPLASLERTLSLCGSNCHVIALGSINDVKLYRRMLKAGAVDYIVKPLTTDMLSQASAAAFKTTPAKNKESKGKETKVIVMIGTRGGVGTSTLVINTGWFLAHELKLNVVVLDLDLQFGTSSLALDLEPGRGLHDIVSSADRVDGLMIASSMAAESDRFSVLAAEESLEDYMHIDGMAINALLKEMRSNFDVIVVDMPRHLFTSQKRLLSMADEIIIVTELSLAGVRDTLRIQSALKNLESDGRRRIVGARVNASKSGHIDIEAFEKSAQVKLDAIIPEDQKTLAQAANSGKSLFSVAKGSPVAKSISQLAFKISGKEIETGTTKKTAGVLEKLLKSRKPVGKDDEI